MRERLKLDLQWFAEESGVEDVSAAETPEMEAPEAVSESETGVEKEVAAEPEKQNNFEKAFAKRLAAERSKWESEVNEKYKDYDTHKELSQFLQEQNGLDALTLKEQIEMAKLQERAEKGNVPLEVQKRLEYLEERDAKAAQLEAQQQQEQQTRTYFDTLNKFMDGKDATTEELNKFMIDNELTYDPNNIEKSLNIAYKAMRAEKLEAELKTAKESAVKEYLQSKSAPKVEGAGTPGVVVEDTSKMGWNDINKRVAARITANQQT